MQQKKNRPAEKPAQTKYGRKLELRKKEGGSFDFVSLEERGRLEKEARLAAARAAPPRSIPQLVATKPHPSREDGPEKTILTVKFKHSEGKYYLLRDPNGNEVFLSGYTVRGFQERHKIEIDVGMTLTALIAPDRNSKGLRAIRIEPVR